MSNESTDKELVKRVQKGDKGAFDVLVLKYEQKIVNLVMRYVRDPEQALDISQEAFIKAYRALPRFRGDSAFYTWLYRIAVNTCLSYLRSHKKLRQKTIPLEDVHGVVADTEPSATQKAESKILEQTIQKLPPRLKSVFLLHDVEGFKHQEIAHILGCSVGTSKSQLFKARKKMRKLLEHKQWM